MEERHGVKISFPKGRRPSDSIFSLSAKSLSKKRGERVISPPEKSRASVTASSPCQRKISLPKATARGLLGENPDMTFHRNEGFSLSINRIFSQPKKQNPTITMTKILQFDNYYLRYYLFLYIWKGR
jgi:hypothetical protein